MVSIDMPAGPSEVLVIADKYANPVHIAADLLSQVLQHFELAEKKKFKKDAEHQQILYVDHFCICAFSFYFS